MLLNFGKVLGADYLIRCQRSLRQLTSSSTAYVVFVYIVTVALYTWIHSDSGPLRSTNPCGKLRAVASAYFFSETNAVFVLNES